MSAPDRADWQIKFSKSVTDVAFSLVLTKAQARIVRQIVRDDIAQPAVGWRYRHVQQLASVAALECRGIVSWVDLDGGARRLVFTPAGRLIAELLAHSDGGRAPPDQEDIA